MSNTGARTTGREGVHPWPGRLLLTGLGLAAATVIVAVVAFLPNFLVEKDLERLGKQTLPPAELLRAKNDVRATLFQGLAGAFLLLGAYLTWRQIQVTRDGQRTEAHLNREGQITERFTRAIDQLGSDKMEVRLGGIYALERIARDSKDDHGPVMEVLTAFLREHARPNPEGFREGEKPRADFQAAATVIGRRDAKNDPAERLLDLSEVALPGVLLNDSHLQGVYLADAILSGAHLRRADLQGVVLDNANLEKAGLNGADLREAALHDANLRSANLRGADLSSALNMTREQLDQAITDDATKLPPGL